jgi:hypothetical protein
MSPEEIGFERSYERSHEFISIDVYGCSIDLHVFYSFFFPSFRVDELIYTLMGYPHRGLLWILLLEHTRDDFWTPPLLSFEV